MLHGIMDYKNSKNEYVGIYAHEEYELIVVVNETTCESKVFNDLKNGLYRMYDYIVNDNVKYIYGMVDWLLKDMWEELQDNNRYLSNNENLRKVIETYMEDYCVELSKY